MTVQSPRLGAPAFEVILMDAAYHWPDGWSLRVCTRRSGSADFEQEQYKALDVFEYHQVVADTLALKLGI